MTSALVFHDGSAITLGGLTLTERTVLLAYRAGLRPARLWGATALDASSVARLRERGATVVQLPPASAPLEGTADTDDVVVVGPNILLEPAALAEFADLARHAGNGAAAAFDDTGAPLIIRVPAGAVAARSCRSIEAMVSSLAMREPVQAVSLAHVFCRRVGRGDDARSLEQDYTRHLNGGANESYFTKKIRRFSVPLTSRLVRLGARPTHVTLGGLALAGASAALLARGSYGAGLLGAVLYYTSMIFDCSDGEVARLTVRDSSFGAWLETIVDYVTYFLLLAALVVAGRGRTGPETFTIVAAIAVAGSIIVIAVAGYLRHRVAGADPGQFDDASARAMASASWIHRFARWGRQWVKRSTVAHLVVILAAIDQLPVLLYLWAFGAAVSSVVILAVQPFVVRKVAVTPAGVRGVDGGS